LIDEEVQRIIRESHKRAEDLILANRDKLELIANALLEHETLDGEQVAEIVRTGKFTPPPEDRSNLTPPSGAQAVTPLSPVIKPSSEPPPLPGLGNPATAPA